MPRKATEPAPQVSPPPGPISFEVRINGKIALLQHVHNYQIDQGDEQITITATLKLPVTPEAADDGN
jgi:hypothetical protein